MLAGEPSGDNLGGVLMDALKARADYPIIFDGVGGLEMQARDLKSLFPMQDICVMGLGPVLARLPLLLRRIKDVVAHIQYVNPDVIVLIDSQEFSAQVAKHLRRKGIRAKILQYVCPMVWAWRQGRAKRLEKILDRILALYSFEPEIMKALKGPETIYVGHPLLNLIPDITTCVHDHRPPQVLLLPGSRHGELSRLLPVFEDVAARLSKKLPGARFILPTLSHVHEHIHKSVQTWETPVELLPNLNQKERLVLFAKSDGALATSGTVTLELALCGCPTVATYKVHPFIAWFFQHLIKVPFITLPNLILNHAVITERLQKEAKSTLLTEDLLKILTDKKTRQKQIDGFSRIKEKMKLKHKLHPEEAAADIILDILH